VVGRVPAAGLLVPLEHGELGHPHERPPAVGDEAALGGQAGSEITEDGLGHRGAVGGDQEQVARLGAGDLAQGVAHRAPGLEGAGEDPDPGNRSRRAGRQPRQR
jgi:hypothetical protein